MSLAAQDARWSAPLPLPASPWPRVLIVALGVVLVHGLLWWAWPQAQPTPAQEPVTPWVSVQVQMAAPQAPEPSAPPTASLVASTSPPVSVEPAPRASPKVPRVHHAASPPQIAPKPKLVAKPEKSTPRPAQQADLLKPPSTPLAPALPATPNTTTQQLMSSVAASPSATTNADPEVPPSRALPAPVAPAVPQPKLSNPKPIYPRLSQRLGEQGVVRVRAHVTAQGVVDAVELLASSGFARLDQAAMKAVQAWIYVLPSGQEMEPQWLNVPVTFVLQGR